MKVECKYTKCNEMITPIKDMPQYCDSMCMFKHYQELKQQEDENS